LTSKKYTTSTQGIGLICPHIAVFGWFIQVNKVYFVCDITDL